MPNATFAGALRGSWWSGDATPAAALGVDGDYFEDTTTASVYRKSGGSWSLHALGGSAGGVYVVGAKKEAVPTASEVIIYHSFPGTATYTLAASAANSRCTARTAATAQTDFDLQKNGASIGTIRFAAAGTVASYVGVAGTTFTGGTDDVRVVAPASPDVSIAGLSFALYLTT